MKKVGAPTEMVGTRTKVAGSPMKKIGVPTEMVGEPIRSQGETMKMEV